MTNDPRTLNYPGFDQKDGGSDAERAGLEPSPGRTEGEERRTGTNDELKELDRADRRKSPSK